jgi:hypothetical protein
MQQKPATLDPVLADASKTLPDPGSLTPTQRRAIRLARTQRLIMVRNGWKAASALGTSHVSFKTTDPLEALGLVRRVLDRARWTLVCTGAGMMLLDVVDARKTARGTRATS